MGYGAYVLPDGREAGYLIEATCDVADCKTEIDRGFGYLCGERPNGWRDPDEPGCGNYYCPDHQGDHDCPNDTCGVFPCQDCENGQVEPCVREIGHAGKHQDEGGFLFTITEYCRECQE